MYAEECGKRFPPNVSRCCVTQHEQMWSLASRMCLGGSKLTFTLRGWQPSYDGESWLVLWEFAGEQIGSKWEISHRATA